MTINMLLLCGAIAGLLVGILIPRQRFGCVALLIVPLAMIVYVNRLHSALPEIIRSTSALDFFFVPFWPSLGALTGFYVARAVRAWLARRNDDGS